MQRNTGIFSNQGKKGTSELYFLKRTSQWEKRKFSVFVDEVTKNIQNTFSSLAEKHKCMKKCFRSCSFYECQLNETQYPSTDESLLLSAKSIYHCQMLYSFMSLQENSLIASVDIELIPRAQRADNLSFLT
jgi:hypothetical protein